MQLAKPILEVSELEVFYGRAQALHCISFSLQSGEMLSLIGSNGVGKSTLLKMICGLAQRQKGAVSFTSQNLQGVPTSKIVGQGIALVPEGRRLFRSISVEENLVLGGR